MEVILQETISSLGKAGDVVKVRDGFARNYLLPQGKAVVADPRRRKELEHHQRVAAARATKTKQAAVGLAEKIAAQSVTIACQAGEEDRLFGSVTNRDIAEALHKVGFHLDRRQIHLEQPIKQLGEFSVEIRLHPEVTAALKVWVVRA